MRLNYYLILAFLYFFIDKKNIVCYKNLFFIRQSLRPAAWRLVFRASGQLRTVCANKPFRPRFCGIYPRKRPTYHLFSHGRNPMLAPARLRRICFTGRAYSARPTLPAERLFFADYWASPIGKLRSYALFPRRTFAVRSNG